MPMPILDDYQQAAAEAVPFRCRGPGPEPWILTTFHAGFVNRPIYEVFFEDVFGDECGWGDSRPIRVLG